MRVTRLPSVLNISDFPYKLINLSYLSSRNLIKVREFVCFHISSFHIRWGVHLARDLYLATNMTVRAGL